MIATREDQVEEHLPVTAHRRQLLADAGLVEPAPTPTRIGVPTAPKDTGVDCTIIPITTAANAGKPSATISGAATAAGVPKPEAPR